MNKIILVSLFTFLISLNGYCQNQFGIKAGYNYFKVINRSDNNDSDNYVNYSPEKNSYTASLFINNWIDTGKYIGYQIEYINYCFGKKASYHSAGSQGNEDYHYKLEYLQFVFIPHFEFGKKWKFFIEPGVYLNWLINSNVKGTDMFWSYGIPKYDTLNQSAKDHFNTSAVGIKAGLGLETPVNKSFNILIENSYSINLTSFDNGPWINFFNATFELGVSYNFDKFKFPFKSKKK